MNWKVRLGFFLVVYIPSSVFFELMVWFILWIFGRDFSWNAVYLAQLFALTPFLLRFVK